MKTQDNRKPILCRISQDGGTFSIDYAADEMTTGQYRQGYSSRLFDQVPKGTPLIDLQTARPREVMRVILSIPGIIERDGNGIPLTEYLERLKAAGAQITTI